MFKSYEYIGYLGYDETTRQHSYRYKIIDTDFEAVEVDVEDDVEIEIEGTHASEVEAAFWGVIIDVYTKRGLPVASNLFRCMMYNRDQYGWSIDQQVEWQKESNPRWHEVEHDMQMYLTFS